MGVIAIGVVVLGVVLYLAGTGGLGRGGDSGANDGPVYSQQLAEFLPQELGGFQLQKLQAIDAQSITMLGAADAVRGRYSSGMSVLVLNYTSAERASRVVGPVRSAMFPDAQGWKVVEDKAATVGHRVAVLHAESGRLATIWNHGSLVLIFMGDAAQMPAFEKSAPELLSKAQAPPQPATRG